jgi:AcrR family transcriptional regulator
MGSYSKGDATKRKFIMSACKHLESHDESTLTVRSLSTENGYSVAALYKHFESLEYLLDVASVHFLEEYLDRYAGLLDGSKSPLQVYIEGWNLFIECAFVRPEIFYRIFWKTDQETLELAFIDYFRSFPAADPHMNAVQFSVLITSGDMRERDLMLLRPLITSGVMDMGNAEFLSTTNELIVSGLLWRATETGESGRAILQKLCSKLVVENVTCRVHMQEFSMQN